MTSDERPPVRLQARLDEPLSRWLWLVKWILALPHVIVLFFLWIAAMLIGIVALVAILITGRYPRPLFDFVAGVLQWSWRVTYYAYGALGTDRYPPFTLGPVPDYPATLDIDYPEQLSRGLVLVKWWLLAIPHYLVIGFFVGATTLTINNGGPGAPETISLGGGLVGLLTLFVGIALLFTGRYPRGLFDFLLGMHRWAYRVFVYAGLMSDVYPPFRLDQGGLEPAIEPPTETRPVPPHVVTPTT